MSSTNAARSPLDLYDREDCKDRLTGETDRTRGQMRRRLADPRAFDGARHAARFHRTSAPGKRPISQRFGFRLVAKSGNLRARGKEPAGNRNAIGAMQHCAFVVTAERFREVEARLKSRGIDYIGPVPQLPGLLGIYFYDTNGIRLEFACQPADGEMPAVIPCITQTRAEARAELETLPGVTSEWIEECLSALPG